MPAFALDSRRPALTGVRLQAAVHEMGASAQHPHDDPTRSIFCNRTLNLRSIRAIGFDMDYTLIEYNVMAWEGKAYEYGAPPAQGIPIPPTACMHASPPVSRRELSNTRLHSLPSALPCNAVPAAAPAAPAKKSSCKKKEKVGDACGRKPPGPASTSQSHSSAELRE